MNAMLEAIGVSKMFGAVRALNEINVTIGPGVTGLLGPNGSGKSTLLKLFSGQLKPDTGTVRLMGGDPIGDAGVRRELGLCPEQDRFYEDMTGREFVGALTSLHGLGAEDATRATDWALQRVGMSAHGKKPLGAMSRGMRQRIKMAQAIAHRPQVILLDEPLTGTDPVGRSDLIQLVKELGEEGHCVVVSSHVLHEVEAMTNDVIFIRFGRLRARGDVFELRTLIKDRPYRLKLRVRQARQFARELLNSAAVKSVEIHGPDTCEITTVQLDECIPLLRQTAERLGHTIEQLTAPDADLQSVYEYLLGRIDMSQSTRRETWVPFIGWTLLRATQYFMETRDRRTHRPLIIWSSFSVTELTEISGSLLTGVLPIMALLFGSGVIREEIEQQTLTYSLVRPIPRQLLYASRILAAALPLAACLAPALVIISMKSDGRLSLPLLCAAAALGSFAYVALFALVGQFARRPLGIGLVFMAWESLASKVPGVFGELTLTRHVGVLGGVPSKVLLTPDSAAAAPWVGAVVLGIVATLLILGGAQIMARRGFTLPR